MPTILNCLIVWFSWDISTSMLNMQSIYFFARLICRLAFFLDWLKCLNLSFLWGAAPEVGADNLCEVLMIDDKDNSFSTPSFRIRYARQDVILAIMISFYVSYGRYEVTSTLSLSVILYINHTLLPFFVFLLLLLGHKYLC